MGEAQHDVFRTHYGMDRPFSLRHYVQLQLAVGETRPKRTWSAGLLHPLDATDAAAMSDERDMCAHRSSRSVQLAVADAGRARNDMTTAAVSSKRSQ